MINLPAKLYSLPLNLLVMRRVFGESEAGGRGSVQPGDCFVRFRSCHHACARFWCDLKKGFIIVHLFFSGAGLSDFVPSRPLVTRPSYLIIQLYLGSSDALRWVFQKYCKFVQLWEISFQIVTQPHLLTIWKQDREFQHLISTNQIHA